MIIIEFHRKAKNHKFLIYELFRKTLFPVRQLIGFEKYICIKINKKQFKVKSLNDNNIKMDLKYSED